MLIFFFKLTYIKKNIFFIKVSDKEFKIKFNLFYLNFLSFFFNKQPLKTYFFDKSLKNSIKGDYFKHKLIFVNHIIIYFKNSTFFNYHSKYLSIKNILIYIYKLKKSKFINMYIKNPSFFKKKHRFKNFIKFLKKKFLNKIFFITHSFLNYYFIIFQVNDIILKINKNKLSLKKVIFLQNFHNSDKNDFFTSDYNKKFIELQKQYILKQKYFFFINTFLYNFLNFFLKKKLFFSLKKLNNFFKNHFKIFEKPFLFLKLKKKIKNFRSLNFIKVFYKIFYISLKLKDSLFFIKWFTLKIEDINFKKHKNYIHFFHSFLKIFHRNLFARTKTFGVYFSISGKIGVTGDSKKRKIFFNYGMHSSSKKNLKLNLSRTQVKTKTGVMGISYNIFF
jgi:hypothetical protein